MFGKKKPNNSLRNLATQWGGISRTSGRKNKRFALTDKKGSNFYANLDALRNANFARQKDAFARLAMLMGNKTGYEQDYFNVIKQMQDRVRGQAFEEGNRNTIEGFASRGMTGGSAEALALSKLHEGNMNQAAQDNDQAFIASKNKYNEDLNTNSNLIQILANNVGQMQGQAFAGADVYNSLNNTSANNFSANNAASGGGSNGILKGLLSGLATVGTTLATGGNVAAGAAAGSGTNAALGGM